MLPTFYRWSSQALMDQVGYSGILSTQWKWEDSPDLCLIIYFLVLFIKKNFFFKMLALFVCFAASDLSCSMQDLRCGAWAQLPQGTWDLRSPTRDQSCITCLEGEFLTTGPPGKLLLVLFIFVFVWTFQTSSLFGINILLYQSQECVFLCVCGFCFLSSPWSPMIIQLSPCA